VDQAQSMRHSLALDKPVGEQYLVMLAGLFHGQGGRSIFSGEEITPMILGAMAYTAPLAFASWLSALLFGIVLGAGASHRGDAGVAGWIAGGVSSMISVGMAVPVALTGLIILWVAVPFQTLLADDGKAALAFLCAVIVLAVNIGCAIARTVQASIQEARREPFYLALRASGIPDGLGMDIRLLRAGLGPVLSLAGMEAGFLLGGTMIIETIFARPGLGRLAVDAILRGDFPVVQLALALGALGYCICAMSAETLAYFLDPRLRTS
jgi:peptide/nickel transport system permease protein